MSETVNAHPYRDADNYIRRSLSSITTLMIFRDDDLVWSRTYGRTGSLQTLNPVFSITKSVISLLIGVAIDKGYIQSTEQTLNALLDARRCNLDPSSDSSSVTLHQLLSMTAGFTWRDGRLGNEPMLSRIIKYPNWLESILQLPVKQNNKGQFQYNSAVSHLLSIILSHRTGMSAEKFAQIHLFKPLNISHYRWSLDPQGYSTGGWGLELASTDLAKLGMLIVNGGRFEEQTVVSCAWMTLSSRQHVQVNHQPPAIGYGYQWWLCELNGQQAVVARGFGGQFICCLPENRVIIVITSTMSGRGKNYWPLFEQYLLPELCR